MVYTGGPWKHRDYFVVPSGGGSPRRITRRSGQAGACSFMPDGASLVCHGYDRGLGAIDVIALEDGARTAITTGPEWDYKPVVAPTGGWLAFSRSNDGPSAIWLQRLDGGVAHPLTPDGPINADDRWPTWTASGDALFFHRIVDQGTGIGVYDRASRQMRTIVPETERPDGASFDPQGDRIVYASRALDHSTLRIQRVSGGPPTTIDTGGLDAAFPRWSPDGSRIAFLGRSGDRWRICTVPSDGGAGAYLGRGVRPSRFVRDRSTGLRTGSRSCSTPRPRPSNQTSSPWICARAPSRRSPRTVGSTRRHPGRRMAATCCSCRRAAATGPGGSSARGSAARFARLPTRTSSRRTIRA